MWWYAFIQHWNGLSILCSPYATTVPDILIQTDASGYWGCGAVFSHRWLQLQWPKEWRDEAIMVKKELVPIVLAIVVWGYQLARKDILVKSDNLNVVTAINKGSCREAMVMHLLRCMWFFVAQFDIRVVAEHLPGKDNIIANQLSRNNITQATRTSAGLSKWPIVVPISVLHIISKRS